MVDLISAGFGGGQAVIGGFANKSPDTSAPAPDAGPQVGLPQAAAQQAVSTPGDQATQELMDKRTSALKEAITAALPRFFYPVSDVRFTIYKDSSGQYITRFTNIISGQTTQVPEPELMAQISSSIGNGSNFVHTSA